jgi:uncharacterized membrane protein YeiB
LRLNKTNKKDGHMGEAEFAIVGERDHSLAVGPVLLGERIVSLDVLRGIAVLGILVMNIYAFAMPFIAYANPLAMGGNELHNIGTWFFTHIFFDQKFLSIFAMLFGAGVILMTGRAESRGGKYGRIFYRRQFWLIVIGAVHGYLIWFGDILFTYAVIGMLVFLVRKRRPKTLIIIACLLLPLALFMSYGFSVNAERTQAEASEITALQQAGEELTEEQEKLLDDWEQFRAFVAPTDADLQKDLEAYKGSYTEIVAHRAPIVASMQVFTTLFFGISRVAALMMIGMALMKLGVFSGERTHAFYRNLMLAGYLIGLPFAIFSACASVRYAVRDAGRRHCELFRQSIHRVRAYRPDIVDLQIRRDAACIGELRKRRPYGYHELHHALGHFDDGILWLWARSLRDDPTFSADGARNPRHSAAAICQHLVAESIPFRTR